MTPPVPSAPDTTPIPTEDLTSKFRGATVEDLDLPPALSIHPTTPIATAQAMSYERDYSQLTVISPQTKSLLGYVSADKLKSPSMTGKTVAGVMNRFDRRRSKGYSLITPETPLEELLTFFERGEEFAVVTDAARRFVLGVATRGDLEEFLKRRP